jgi:hypothetical protein
MILQHRWSRRLSLLVSGALDGADRRAVEAHVAGCDRCRMERAELESVLALVSADPTRRGEPGVPLGALVTRVQARLDEAPPASPWKRALWPLASAAAVTLVVVMLGQQRPAEVPRAAEPRIEVSEEFLARMERSMVREHAARYLSEARDVLVTVAASPRKCDHDETVDLTEETRRSRELLARRALLVESDRIEVASALPVLEDVENVLRDVAALPSCARKRDLDTINREISERSLLLKISLVSRELQG